VKRIERRPLSGGTLGFLAQRTERVRAAEDSASEARRLWKLQKNRAFQEVRSVLRDMASGRERCMYCEDSQGTAIEHFWPKSHYPLRAFEWTNYLWACSHCNSNEKRDRFPLDEQDQPLLIDPTREDPRDHLLFSPATGEYVSRPESSKGAPSIDVFGLDRPLLERGRRAAWIRLEVLIPQYAALAETGDDEGAQKIETTIREASFIGVLAFMLRIADGSNAKWLIHPRCLQAIRERPEIRNWL
jgi:uncharacterized protein (TIGR02646 family)